ncbi:MAG: VOC family protein, partial [Bdellovibrionales bacterium]|nr:VOC family protein [Bdellovibrionales bacterium]
MSAFNITRCAHAELLVTDFDKARRFYIEALGLLEIDSDRERIYLGGFEERDRYSLVLRKSTRPGLGHLAFRVANESDLDNLAQLYIAHNCPIRWFEPNEIEKGQGRALRVQDPFGLPI